MKKLIETLEIQLIAPSTGYGVSVDNMLAEWGAVPYSQLSVMLVNLRFLSMIHQTHHWQARGDSFYGDHLLYERLYNDTVSEIDAIAEKSVGLGTDQNVHLPLQVAQLMKLVQGYGMSSTIPNQSELARRSLVAEVGFLRCAEHVSCSLKEAGLMTNGLENMLQGFCDVHEGHVYLLKKRCQRGM